MFDFASQVLGFLTVAWNYLLNVFQSLLLAVQFLSSGLSFPLTIVGYMPEIIGSAIVSFLAIFVIRFLIGR